MRRVLIRISYGKPLHRPTDEQDRQQAVEPAIQRDREQCHAQQPPRRTLPPQLGPVREPFEFCGQQIQALELALIVTDLAGRHRSPTRLPPRLRRPLPLLA